jgi:ABC-type sulfate transport system permease component
MVVAVSCSYFQIGEKFLSLTDNLPFFFPNVLFGLNLEYSRGYSFAMILVDVPILVKHLMSTLHDIKRRYLAIVSSYGTFPTSSYRKYLSAGMSASFDPSV